jgi:hypothetical protein
VLHINDEAPSVCQACKVGLLFRLHFWIWINLQ